MKVILLFVLLVCAFQLHAQNIYSLEKRLEYVQYLGKNKDFKTQLTEIESIENSYPNLPSVKLQKVNCLLGLNQYQRAYTAINNFMADSQTLKEYIFLLFKCSLLADSFNNSKLAPLANAAEADKELNCYYYFYTQGPAFAVKYCTENVQNKSVANNIKEVIINSLSGSCNKPGLAATLSVIPGLGQVYANQKTDGLTALFSVGINAFVAYSAFGIKGNESVLGWTAASLATGFYLGNIVGAWQAAKRINNLQIKKSNYEIKKRIADLAF